MGNLNSSDYSLEKSKNCYKNIEYLFNEKEFDKIIDLYETSAFLFTDIFKRKSCFKIAWSYLIKKNFIKASEFYIEIINFEKFSEENVEIIANSYIGLAVIMLENSDLSMAKYYLENAQFYINKYNLSSIFLDLILLYLNACINKNKNKNYFYQYDIYLKSIENDLKEKNKNILIILDFLWIKFWLEYGSYNNAIKKLSKLEKVYDNMFILYKTVRGGDLYLYLSEYYFRMENYKKALNMYEIAEKIYIEYDDSLSLNFIKSIKLKICTKINDIDCLLKMKDDINIFELKKSHIYNNNNNNNNLEISIFDYSDKILKQFNENFEDKNNYILNSIEYNYKYKDIYFKLLGFYENIGNCTTYKSVYLFTREFINDIFKDMSIQMSIFKSKEFVYVFTSTDEKIDYDKILSIEDLYFEDKVVKTDSLIIFNRDNEDEIKYYSSNLNVNYNMVYVYIPISSNNSVDGVFTISKPKNLGIEEIDIKLLSIITSMVSDIVLKIKLNSKINDLDKDLEKLVDDIDSRSQSYFEKSYRDLFTRFYNLEGLERLMSKYFNEADKCYEGLFAFVKLDNFKKFNFRYGNILGDEYLKIFSSLALDEFMKFQFIPCRVRGNYFVFLFKDVDKNQIEKILEKISSNLSSFKDENLIKIKFAFKDVCIESMKDVNRIVDDGYRLLK